MARSDPKAVGDFERQQAVWLAEALHVLPVGIGLIDADGAFIAMSGALSSIIGDMVPSRTAEGRRLWQVFDENGNRVDPHNWPSECALRGERVMRGMEGVYLPGTDKERRLRLFSTPFVDSTGQSAGLVLVQDLDLDLPAQERRFERMQQRFVETLVDTIRKVGTQSDDDAVKAHREIARRMGFITQALPAPADGLSRREEQVLRLMAWGNSRKEIGTQLGITVKTVEFHRSSAARKLELRSRVDVVRYALDRGWLRASD